jgi:hypothetical protein
LEQPRRIGDGLAHFDAFRRERASNWRLTSERLPLVAAATTAAAAAVVIATTAAATATSSGATTATAATAAKATAAATTTAAAVAAATTAAKAAAATTAAAKAAAATATAAAATFSARLRLVHAQRTPIDVLAVERLDGTLRILFVFHLDERKTTRATGVPVEHDLDVGHLAAVAFERGAQSVFGGLE